MVLTARSDSLLDLPRFETASAHVHATRYAVDHDLCLVNVRQPAPFGNAGDMLTDTAGLFRLTAPHNLVTNTRPFSAYVAPSRHP